MAVMSAGTVTRAEFYATIDDILDLPPGTITGTETLKELPATWDSLAIVSYIAACNGLFGIVLSGEKVKATKSIAELMELVAPHIADAQ
jgi:acyl carrier protein